MTSLYWKPPKHRSDWPNSLTDAVSSAPPGALVVYRHAPPSSMPRQVVLQPEVVDCSGV